MSGRVSDHPVDSLAKFGAGRDSSPRNIHVAAAAVPRLVTTRPRWCRDSSRRSRGGAATRHVAAAASSQLSSPRNIHVRGRGIVEGSVAPAQVAAARASAPVDLVERSSLPPRRLDDDAAPLRAGSVVCQRQAGEPRRRPAATAASPSAATSQRVSLDLGDRQIDAVFNGLYRTEDDAFHRAGLALVVLDPAAPAARGAALAEALHLPSLRFAAAPDDDDAIPAAMRHFLQQSPSVQPRGEFAETSRGEAAAGTPDLNLFHDVAAAASPRPVSAEYPRRRRGVAATRLNGLSTWIFRGDEDRGAGTRQFGRDRRGRDAAVRGRDRRRYVVFRLLVGVGAAAATALRFAATGDRRAPPFLGLVAATTSAGRADVSPVGFGPRTSRPVV